MNGYRWCLLASLLLLAGCHTATTPGSIYRTTGSYAHLLAEPTFDIGAGPPEGTFYSLRVPHYDADGHGVFDIPVVFCEQVMFAPTWVFSWMLYLTGSEPYLWYPRPSAPDVEAGAFIQWVLREGVGWVIAVPGMVSYMASFTAVMAFDTVVHDVPVIVVGFPFRLVNRLGSGG